MTDGMLAPRPKPRYFNEETKSLISNEKKRKMFCFSCPVFFYTLCCGSKRRRAFCSIILLVLVLAYYSVVNASLTDKYLSTWLIGDLVKRKSTSSKQSYGFFTSISESEWKSKQKKMKNVRKQQMKKMKKKKSSHLDKYGEPSKFYEINWQLEFTCPNEELVGRRRSEGSGLKTGKWICEPSRIGKRESSSILHREREQKLCIIYTSSVKLDELDFETGLFERINSESRKSVSDKCEIHVFDPTRQVSNVKTISDIHVHPWGFIGEKNVQREGNSQFKTIRETVEDLGHQGHYIDLFVLDCEGCEFNLYKDIVEIGIENMTTTTKAPTVFLQLVMQVHGFATPVENTYSFFETLTNEGSYAIFHKSATEGTGGNVQDYGFIKLRNDFFI